VLSEHIQVAQTLPLGLLGAPARFQLNGAAANGPGAAPMVIGVRMELAAPELERAGTRLEMEDPLLRIAVDPSRRHMQGIRLIRQPERSAIQL
jgi:hypothetical protein